MAQAKVKVNFDISRFLTRSNFANRRLKRELGTKIIKEMKRMIAKGNSPVKGFRRFPPYAAQRGNAKSNYPENIDGKSTRPVNMELTGDMLNDLDFRSAGKGKIEVGVMGDSFSELKSRVHNTGERRDIPQRKFIPFEEGDEFAARIQKLIRDIHQKRLNGIIKKSNR